jgi:lysophospholipase L1-like esterase
VSTPLPPSRLWAPAMAVVLLVSISMNLALIWYSNLRDDAKAALAAQLARREHQSGPTIIIGDSIIAAAGSRQGQALNLAVAGATISWIADNQLDMVADLGPGRIIVAAGINDLRSGASPGETAARLLALASSLKSRMPGARIILMAILPPARDGEFASLASVADVLETNSLLREQAAARGFSMIDHSLLFARADGLEDRLTYDGLHLNAAGQAVLSGLLFEGLAGQRSEQPH